MKALFLFSSCVWSCLGFMWFWGSDAAQKTVVMEATQEQLVVFTQPVDTHFLANSLPLLQAWAKAENIDCRVIDVAQTGAPSSITATPAIVFQNQQGRSIYASRYAEMTTIKNFVRTSRLRPQGGADNCSETVLTWQPGRATFIAPIKLTALGGSLPTDWNDNDFLAGATTAIAEGMTNFTLMDSSCLERTDRAFYCDLHPYRSEDGQWFLSLELYSMFNCIRPVWSTGDQPLQGNDGELAALFRRAGEAFQQEISRQIQQSKIGDAWTPIADELAPVTWEDLDLALPAGTQATALPPLNLPLPQAWKLSGPALPGVPPLFFRFMPPLERYAGEVPDFSGTLRLHPNGSLHQGDFTANLKTLTMGMAELDDKVKKKYIYVKRFPKASFSFELPENTPLRPGQVNRIPVQGAFSFMGKSVDKMVQAEILPVSSPAGTPTLEVHVAFDLNITDDYDIQGPDGPDPARKTLQFDLNFIVTP